MSTIKAELKRVRLAKPLIERVWLWLADHPEKNSTEIAKALNEPLPGVSSILTILGKRGMANSQKVRDDHTGRISLRHSVAIRAYDLLPFKDKQAPKPASTPAPESEPVQVQNPKSILDTLTVRQARALYEELKELFGA